MVGHLVACGDAMYLFGGRDILDNGKLLVTNVMLKFTPEWKEKNGVMTGLTSIVCTRVAAGGAPERLQFKFKNKFQPSFARFVNLKIMQLFCNLAKACRSRNLRVPSSNVSQDQER